jgi:UDP-N-acetylmuramoylalanine--D-glutamate ligase
MNSSNRHFRLEPGMHVVIVGLGKSGFSAAKYLLQSGVRVSVSEGGRPDRLERGDLQWLQENGVPVETSGHSSELFLAADALLVSPGVPLTLPSLRLARQHGVPIFGELALAPDHLPGPVVAVTGTNGKSTVTALLGEIFSAAGRRPFVGGNIGVPLTDYLAGPREAGVVVLEVSSFQLDSAGDFRPDVAVLLNISPDHLDRYESFDAYAAAKFRIFAAQRPTDAAIINGDDPEITSRLASAAGSFRPPGRIYQFSQKPRGGAGAFLQGEEVILTGLHGEEREAYSLTGTTLRMAPHAQNAMAAILAGRLQDCPAAAIHRALKSFSLLPHRLALVAEISGVRFYDDSKATNVGAVQAALQAMDRQVVLIAGGRDKGGDFSPLRREMGAKIKGVVLLGEAREKMAATFAGLVHLAMADGMMDAVRRAFLLAAPGEAVLLAPACASFDMFASYAERGRIFRECVAAMQQEAAAASCRHIA